MTIDLLQIALVLETAIFLSVVLLHMVHANSTAIWLYAAQSACVVALITLSSIGHITLLLGIALVATFVVKLCFAPYFLLRLVRTHQLKFSSSTYLSTPLTLLVLGAIVALTQSNVLQPLAALSEHPTIVFISLSVILGSFFLVVNRKGALSQILGILSIENGIVSFALASGLEQNPGLQLGITFDICIWIWIASVFISMMYRQFGSLDVTTMRHLTD